MKILYLVPSSGGIYYCQNCLRESAHIYGLRNLGQDVMVIPLYLPLLDDEYSIGKLNTPVFYNSLTLFIRQKLPFLPMPVWLKKILTSDSLFTVIRKFAGSVKARNKFVSEMTLKMIKDENKIHEEEIKEILLWISGWGKPDVIHAGSILLAGPAVVLKNRTGARVFCSAQDEDSWIDAMPERFKNKCYEVLKDKLSQLDGIIVPTRYYKDVVIKKLSLPEEKVFVVYPGIEVNWYDSVTADFTVPSIGYLSKMTESCGLGILVDAFIILKKRGWKTLRLVVGGGMDLMDRKFVAKLKRRLKNEGLFDEVFFYNEFGRDFKKKFFSQISLLSVPVLKGEAFGTYIIEAMACGVPVVQPDVGAYGEIINLTQGGIVYKHTGIESLANAIEFILKDFKKAQEYGMMGRNRVREYFTIDRMAERLIEVYRGTMQ